MKVFALIVITLTLFSCQNSANEILVGKWKVSTSAFQAVYQIQKGKGGSYDCRVVNYNDGTTIYSEKSTSHPFVFKNVSLEQDSSVDGVSGATKTGVSASNSHEISIVNDNQIKVVSHLLNQEKVELWTRVK